MVWMPHWPLVKMKNNIKYDLLRIKKLLHHLGDPHKKIKQIIHVGGTNGKGSTVAFLSSILKKAGYSVHSYTSPHLFEFNERIRIDGEKISNDYLFSLCEAVRFIDSKYNIEASFFEATTAIAFMAFAENSADITLLEVGLGGRLDATNIIQHPLVTVITPISLDHTEYLGNSLQLIAKEKAGIIKSGAPCILSCQYPEVFNVLLSDCKKKKVSTYAFEYDFMIRKNDHSFIFENKSLKMNIPYPGFLKGDHQLVNAATSIATIHAAEIPVQESMIKSGVESAQWPGRIENYSFKRYPHQIYFDGAHNESGAFCLSKWIQENVKTKNKHLILGMTNNRDVCAFVRHFSVQCVHCVPVMSESLSYKGEEIQQLILRSNLKFETNSYPGILEALEKIVKSINEEPGFIIVTGSLFLAADLKKAIAYLNLP
jgi:dihydrofolate synthase/folylpolyglutamate synthase